MLRKKLTEQLERETLARQEAEESLEVVSRCYQRRAKMHDEALDQVSALASSVKLILDTLQEVRKENAELQLQLAKWKELFCAKHLELLAKKGTSDWLISFDWN